ncbi:hypothetical protein FUAX_55820 (plasmid) [Fulvitalea axinellae]|uniref:PKD domain-containing protein n=1 Tax=Fulvitalea axinellae TaxID=1182444 RepID=A0AAU9DPI1_9BACT|nr:hypothetical protein FUAX_55820 [Fulvitalea axinellae]
MRVKARVIISFTGPIQTNDAYDIAYGSNHFEISELGATFDTRTAAKVVRNAIVSEAPSAFLQDYTVYDDGSDVVIEAKNYGVQYQLYVLYNPDQDAEVMTRLPIDNTVQITDETVTNVKVKGEATGAISITLSWATSPTFKWWKVNDTNFSAVTKNVTGLTAGTYGVKVTDGPSSVTKLYTVTEPERKLGINVNAHNAKIHGASDGSITIAGTGGIPPYDYSWDTNLGNPTHDNVTRYNLPAGVYTATVTDAGGGSVSKKIILEQPDPLLITYQRLGRNVTVFPAGGVSPYRITWPDGSTRESRENLPPGEYTVNVEDKNGATASTSFTIDSIDRFYFAENPVSLELSADNPDTKQNLRFVAEVKVEKEYMSDNFESVLSRPLEQPANKHGETAFDFSALLTTVVGTHVPAFGQVDIERADSLFRRFQLSYSEKHGTPPVAGQFVAREINYILAGGLETEEQSSLFFKDYLSGQPFLDWEPSRKRLFRNQHDYLYFLNNRDDTEKLVVMAKFVMKDESVVEKIIHEFEGTLNRYEVYCVPVGYGQIRAVKVANLSGEIDRYEIWVQDQAGVHVSQKRTFYILDDDENARFFLYRNSLGTVSSIHLTGAGQLTYKTKQRTNGTDQLRTGQRTHSRYTGYMVNNDHAKALQDFLLSRNVWLQERTKYVPVEVSTGSKKLVDESKNLQSVQIKYTEAESALYTPYFGKKIDSEAEGIGAMIIEKDFNVY